jgi:hypothetical protein
MVIVDNTRRSELVAPRGTMLIEGPPGNKLNWAGEWEVGCLQAGAWMGRCELTQQQVDSESESTQDPKAIEYPQVQVPSSLTSEPTRRIEAVVPPTTTHYRLRTRQAAASPSAECIASYTRQHTPAGLVPLHTPSLTTRATTSAT